jgi:UDP-N-acetylglucosamine:LPS N-acetylglucosamine transferase
VLSEREKHEGETIQESRAGTAAAGPIVFGPRGSGKVFGSVACLEECRVNDQKASCDLLLVCSSGGHLLQLIALREVWQDESRLWVTFDKSDTRSLLAEEHVVHAYGPTNRNVRNLVRNLFLAWRVVTRTRPAVVLTTGAGVAIPFAWVARLHGARVVYVESLARISDASLSWRLIAPVADRMYVQWPELSERVRGARYAGAVVSLV